jgi:UDP-glucose 4-epimerase
MAYYLVTGGAGFIGSHIVEALLRDGHAVRVLDDLSTGRAENLPLGVELITASVTDPSAVDRAFDGIDACFHLAAIASVEQARREWLRCHTVNISGTIAVFDAAHRRQRERGFPVPVVYASSAAVYGNLDEIPISEQSPTSPANAYGADKLGCELHAAVAGQLFGLRTIGLRFFNVYGPRQDPKSPYSGVISVFCQKLLRGDRVQIHGDGRQVRDFIYIDDVVDALCAAMRSASAHAQVFNVCTGVGTTITDLGETIARLCGVPFLADHAAARLGDLRRSTGHPAKAAEVLGFTAQISLEEGLARTLKSMAQGRAELTLKGTRSISWHRAAPEPKRVKTSVT